jgi:TolB-like protein
MTFDKTGTVSYDAANIYDRRSNAMKNRISFTLLFIFLINMALCVCLSSPAISYEREIANLSSILASSISKSGKKSIAVVDFTDLQGHVNELGRFIAEEMSGNMTSQSQGFDILDRNHMKKILEEQKLSLSGLMDPDAIKKIGKLAGADVIIAGTITPFGDSIRVSCKAIDTATAKVIGSARGDIAKTATIADLLKLGITGSSAPKETVKQPSSSKVFEKPTYRGHRVDICLTWGQSCHKPAADRFCQLSGFKQARTWKIAYDIGHVTPTYVIGDEKICDQQFCDGFETIECE